MNNRIEFPLSNPVNVRRRYTRNVQKFTYVHAAIDLMSTGINMYAWQHPNDSEMAHGAMAALQYMNTLLDEHLERVRIGREALNLAPLPENTREAADTIYLEHYGIDLRKPKKQDIDRSDAQDLPTTEELIEALTDTTEDDDKNE